MTNTYRKRLMHLIASCLLCISIFLTGTTVHSAQPGFSESYMSGIFYRRLSNVTLTGDQRTDIVNVAMSQIGYTESNNSSDLTGFGNGKKNYTEFGLWYKNNVDSSDAYQKAAWCASFVSWCAKQADIPSSVVTYHAYTPTGYTWFKNNASVYSRQQIQNGKYTPQPGDIIYFKSGSNGNIVNHVGIVVRYGDGVIYTVEGNTNAGENTSDGGSVCLKSYNISNSFIRYICCPNYQ